MVDPILKKVADNLVQRAEPNYDEDTENVAKLLVAMSTSDVAKANKQDIVLTRAVELLLLWRERALMGKELNRHLHTLWWLNSG